MTELIVVGFVVTAVVSVVLFLPIMTGIGVALWYGTREGEM